MSGTGHFAMWARPELVGQSLSALCTSSLQNISAVCSSHSLSEAVLLFSLTLFGLIGSEHNGTSFVKWKSEAFFGTLLQ